MRRVIEIKRNNEVVLVYKDINGFTSLAPADNVYGTYLRKYADNDYFIEGTLSDQTKVLVFAGWPYCNDPSVLLIIALTPKDAKVVYCKPMDIDSVVRKGTEFVLNIRSNVLGEGVTVPIRHRIYQKEGFLYFENLINRKLSLS